KAKLCRGCLLALVLAAAWLGAMTNRRGPRFSIALVSLGPYSPTQLVFSASVTNSTAHAIVLDGILFQWNDRLGRIGSCHGFSGWNHTLKPGEGTTTTCCVPIEAQQVRASTVDDEPGPLRRSVGELAVWTRLDRYPKVSAWLLHRGWVPDGSFHKHP